MMEPEFVSRCRAIVRLFDDPQPGLLSWNMMVAEHVQELYAELEEVRAKELAKRIKDDE